MYEYSKPTCDRCGGPTEGITTMSMFSTQVICMDCKDREYMHPDYDKAVEADREASRNGIRNFPGIGEPEDLKCKGK